MTTSDKTNDNEWQWVVILAIFSFFPITEEPTTKRPKEKPWGGPWRGPFELVAGSAKQEPKKKY